MKRARGDPAGGVLRYEATNPRSLSGPSGRRFTAGCCARGGKQSLHLCSGFFSDQWRGHGLQLTQEPAVQGAALHGEEMVADPWGGNTRYPAPLGCRGVLVVHTSYSKPRTVGRHIDDGRWNRVCKDSNMFSWDRTKMVALVC